MLTSIKIKIDPCLKKAADDLFFDLGLSLNTAINIFLKKAVSEQALPFKLGQEDSTLKALAEYEQMKDARKYKRYNCFDELLKDLDNT